MGKTGKLVMNVGSMFSGKSSELQRQGRRYVLANKKVVFFKPNLDNRFAEEKIISHDKNEVSAIPIDDPKMILIYNMDVALIDEIQFFKKSVVEVIGKLLDRGVDVIASGLDMDRNGNPFGVVPHLLAISEEVNKLRAVCSDCGNDAWISYSKFESEEQVVLGAQEKYMPLCRSCFTSKSK